MLLYKSMCPLFAYSQTLNWKTYTQEWSCTKRAPQPRNEWVGSWRGEWRFTSHIEVRTQALTMFVFIYLPQKYLMGLGQTHWHIFIFTDIVINMLMLLQSYTRPIMQKPVHKLQLLASALTILHITFFH